MKRQAAPGADQAAGGAAENMDTSTSKATGADGATAVTSAATPALNAAPLAEPSKDAAKEQSKEVSKEATKESGLSSEVGPDDDLVLGMVIEKG